MVLSFFLLVSQQIQRTYPLHHVLYSTATLYTKITFPQCTWYSFLSVLVKCCTDFVRFYINMFQSISLTSIPYHGETHQSLPASSTFLLLLIVDIMLAFMYTSPCSKQAVKTNRRSDANLIEAYDQFVPPRITVPLVLTAPPRGVTLRPHAPSSKEVLFACLHSIHRPYGSGIVHTKRTSSPYLASCSPNSSHNVLTVWVETL